MRTVVALLLAVGLGIAAVGFASSGSPWYPCGNNGIVCPGDGI